MKRFLVAFAVLAVSAGHSFACNNDYDCGYGNKCVKDSRNYSLSGICVTPTDKFGNRDFSIPPPRSEPHSVKGCSFSTECDIGFQCVKRDNEIYGVCVK